jgi:hypothetical protein
MLLKTTKNIFAEPWRDELQKTKWEGGPCPIKDKKILPPQWDYTREMKIEDVDIWEVLQEGSGGIGVYAAYWPHAEFYMITPGCRHDGHEFSKDKTFETFYGPGADKKVFERAMQLGIDMWITQTWVDDNDLWLYHKPHPETTKKIILA